MRAIYAQELLNTTEGSARSRMELEPLIRGYAERALTLDAELTTALGPLLPNA